MAVMMDPLHKEHKPATAPKLEIENLENGEVVYQRCIIIKGRYTALDSDNIPEAFATVESSDSSGSTTFPIQSWPISSSRLKIIALLSPGENNLTITTADLGPTAISHTIRISYIPLLQTPPLHLAIMVARDSHLLIDCPPGKHAAISSAHSSLDAAIAKFRMTAYMWQALTAEDMREKGLGRRSFRLEEEWAADTTSHKFMDESALLERGAMRSTAKVHIIRSEKTIAQLRDVRIAQQSCDKKDNSRSDMLFHYFRSAISAHGAPFSMSAHPVVAGLILDSHYSIEENCILGHAALGSHNRSGISLGMMGSHLTYAWPRFMEEITSCLIDTRAPGPTVGNDNNECGTFWEACSVGQGAFLHEVGHAFGAPHTTGIMSRGYSGYWPRNFVSRTAHCTAWNKPGVVVIDGDTQNEAKWDMRENLSFRLLPHFWLPGDLVVPNEVRVAVPTICAADITGDNPHIQISCVAGVANITFNGTLEPSPTISSSMPSVTYTMATLESRFSRHEPLTISVLAMNGKSKTIRDAWRLFNSAGVIRVPGTDLILKKQSVQCDELLECKDPDIVEASMWKWATLLVQKRPDGEAEYASIIDVRTGLVLDGAYVLFRDGTRVNCGPRIRSHGGEHKFGGHAAEAMDIPRGQEIVKVEVSRSGPLRGMRIHLCDGTAWGALSGSGAEHETSTLEAPQGERIIGFFGMSWWGRHFDELTEFGIITAPKGIELPDVVYQMKELQNTDGGQSIDGVEE